MKVNREFLRRNGENYPEIVPENRDFIRFFYARSTKKFTSTSLVVLLFFDCKTR